MTICYIVPKKKNQRKKEEDPIKINKKREKENKLNKKETVEKNTHTKN